MDSLEKRNKRIKSCIKANISDESICRMFGITQEELDKIKSKSKDEKIDISKTKLQKLRERYDNLSKRKDVLSLTLGQSTQMLINLSNAESLMIGFETKTSEEQLKILLKVKKLIEFGNDLPLRVDMAERAYKIFPKKVKLDFISDAYMKASYMKMLNNARGKSIIKFIDAIIVEIDKENDINILRQLLNKAKQFQNIEHVKVSKIERLISKKILEIQKNEKNFKVPTEKVRKIINEIVKEEYDENTVRKMIDETINELLPALQSTNQGKKSLDNNNESLYNRAKRQIIFEIQTILGKKDYNLIDPLTTMERLKVITNDLQAINIVLDNLSANYRLQDAYDLIEEIFRNKKTPDQNSQRIKLKQSTLLKYKNNRIDFLVAFIMKGIKGRISDDNMFFCLIERYIEQYDINPSLIVIGKKEDGTNITWINIMSEEMINER